MIDLERPSCFFHVVLSYSADDRRKNPENLLIFAVGNEGDSNAACTVGSPAVGKNVLSVGASSSGPTRWSATDSDGNLFMSSEQESSDIDTVAFFSSYGPTPDNRIKPEIVAPGDRVRSTTKSVRLRGFSFGVTPHPPTHPSRAVDAMPNIISIFSWFQVSAIEKERYAPSHSHSFN